MKNKTAWLLLMAMVCGCFSLACAEAAMTGYWCSEYVVLENGNYYVPADMGLRNEILLNEDGTFTQLMMNFQKLGRKSEGTWEAVSATEAVLTFENGATQTLTLEEDRLVDAEHVAENGTWYYSNDPSVGDFICLQPNDTEAVEGDFMAAAYESLAVVSNDEDGQFYFSQNALETKLRFELIWNEDAPGYYVETHEDRDGDIVHFYEGEFEFVDHYIEITIQYFDGEEVDPWTKTLYKQENEEIFQLESGNNLFFVAPAEGYEE